MQIGFLGTGLMGAHMVRNLLKAGHTVTVWNRTIAKAEALAADGATVAASPDRAVAGVNLVISMLADGPATEAILSDPALRQALSPGSIWVDMSSAKPEESRAHARGLAPLGVAHLDAPVSGGTRGAEAGTLAIMAGGAADTFDRALPALDAMGRPVLVGPSGSGQLAKLANQAVVAISISAVAEAMLLLERGGADPAAVRDALKGGFADSTILQQHGARMSARDFTPGGFTRLQIKDLDNVLGEAASLGLTLPATQETRRRFARLRDEMAGGELDHSALFLELCDLNQLETKR